MTQRSRHSPDNKPPLRVFLAAAVTIFFLSLSAADSIGFVPSYIDGSLPDSEPLVTGDPAPSDTEGASLATGGLAFQTPTSPTVKTRQVVALSILPQLGEAKKVVQAPAAVQAEPTIQAPLIAVLPERLVIAAIDLDLPVQNPGTRDIAALDTLLQKGPARYVDSVKLGEKGNMLIFAHSSRLPVVHNQMYRAFNHIPDLKTGDTISVEGAGNTYRYSVTSVRRADVHDAVVDLSASLGTRLTLVTCDTLTSKSTRWIVEADFVGVL